MKKKNPVPRELHFSVGDLHLARHLLHAKHEQRKGHRVYFQASKRHKSGIAIIGMHGRFCQT
jgi:hypothetical protein